MFGKSIPSVYFSGGTHLLAFLYTLTVYDIICPSREAPHKAIEGGMSSKALVINQDVVWQQRSQSPIMEEDQDV